MRIVPYLPTGFAGFARLAGFSDCLGNRCGLASVAEVGHQDAGRVAQTSVLHCALCCLSRCRHNVRHLVLFLGEALQRNPDHAFGATVRLTGLRCGYGASGTWTRKGHSEGNGDLSPSAARPARISPVTRERWAQIGITVQFLIVVRTLGEFFRLRHVLGTSFSAAVAAPYVGGALIAACLCWAGVTLYFFRRYALCAWIALAAVVILLVYKIAVIGW